MRILFALLALASIGFAGWKDIAQLTTDKFQLDPAYLVAAFLTSFSLIMSGKETFVHLRFLGKAGFIEGLCSTGLFLGVVAAMVGAARIWYVAFVYHQETMAGTWLSLGGMAAAVLFGIAGWLVDKALHGVPYEAAEVKGSPPQSVDAVSIPKSHVTPTKYPAGVPSSARAVPAHYWKYLQ